MPGAPTRVAHNGPRGSVIAHNKCTLIARASAASRAVKSSLGTSTAGRVNRADRGSLGTASLLSVAGIILRAFVQILRYAEDNAQAPCQFLGFGQMPAQCVGSWDISQG